FSLVESVRSLDSPISESMADGDTAMPHETTFEKPERPRFLSFEERSQSSTIDCEAKFCKESGEEFLDAYDTPQMSESKELLDSISETQIAMNLFLNNEFQMAEDRMAAQAQKSMYHALGYSAIVFIKATMTLDTQDVERAMRVSKDAAAVIDAYRTKFSISDSFYRLSGQMRALTDQELHAELCYAESLLFCSILTFLHDESLSSFVRGALKIRACYQSYRECGRLLKSEIWGGRDWRIKAQFESGTHLGVGTFNLLLSTLPTKILRLLEVVGFSGDKDIGMFELQECTSMTGTLRATLCSLVLLSWHLIAEFLVGAANPDIDICQKLLSPLNNSYPQGAIVLFFRARLNIVMGKIDPGIYFFNKSIDVQDVYRQFHHICFWELLYVFPNTFVMAKWLFFVINSALSCESIDFDNVYIFCDLVSIPRTALQVVVDVFPILF
uniref:Tetratricopeptide repeat protein 39B n=2 Tax=Parascaris univalens TaxID=6257 RepID=A0A915AU17_PARUN